MNLGTVGRTSCAALLGIALQAQLPPEIELDRQLLARSRGARGRGLAFGALGIGGRPVSSVRSTISSYRRNTGSCAPR